MKTLLIIRFASLVLLLNTGMACAQGSASSTPFFTPTQMIVVKKEIEEECRDMFRKQKLPKDSRKGFTTTCVKEKTDRAARFRVPSNIKSAPQNSQNRAGDTGIQPQQ